MYPSKHNRYAHHKKRYAGKKVLGLEQKGSKLVVHCNPRWVLKVGYHK